ncbi:MULTISPECIES: hydrogenase expression/formation protein HypE [Clostridium]|uniref:Hydrogenase expression/formation protein HypE n=1 Tax=Clostridium cibarium TaxID=2762247 RepID=A0ABR8PRP6_9CLOT|nr:MULTISPECIES: hydrogenase expression/formation protein HypE [Clostridium]MBD7910823.1 hydrogenase expression/formation protein HypE [Clostridium cibarium]
MDIITLSHGSGGKSTHDLIKKIFYKYFHNEILLQQGDSGIVDKLNGKIAITTDSYVIKPLFFQGGDIGKLSICGTVNDLAVSGARPLYISVGFIIEEGMKISELERIVESMAKTAESCNVKIVTGDSKVVERGKGDKLYINTAGVGIVENSFDISGRSINEGDKIIVNGTLGDHGITILCEREELNFKTQIESDCNALYPLVQDILSVTKKVKFMRDITRGGLATILNEIIKERKLGVVLKENSIPVNDEVNVVCEMLGFNPLFIANEGKLVVVVSKEEAHDVLRIMRSNPLGKNAAIIGEVIQDNAEKVYLNTKIHGTRILGMLEDDLIPRIC